MGDNQGKKLYQRWYVWLLFYPAAVASFATDKFRAGDKKTAVTSIVIAVVVTLAGFVGGSERQSSKSSAQKELTPEQIVQKEQAEAIAKRITIDKEFLRGFINESDPNLAFKVTTDLSATREQVSDYNNKQSKMNALIKQAQGKQVIDWVCEIYQAQSSLDASTRFSCFSNESSSLSSRYIEFVVNITPENAKQIGRMYKDDKYLVNGVVSKVADSPVTFSPEYKNQTASIVTIYIDGGNVALKK